MNLFHRDIATMLERWTKRGPPQRTCPSDSDIQLKSKPVGTINMEALLRKIDDVEDKLRLSRALVYVNSTEKYDEAIAKYDARLRDDATFAIPPVPRLDRVSDFAEKDVAQLVEHGIITPIDITDIKTNGKMFTVAEMHKTPPTAAWHHVV